MSFIVSQKDEIAYLKNKLEINRSEAENLKFILKKLSKAEEDRMRDVIKTN